MDTRFPKIDSIYKRYIRGDDIPEGSKVNDLIIGEYSKEEYSTLKENDWVWTEKIDGMNCRIICDPEYVNRKGVVSYNVLLQGRENNSMFPSGLVERFINWRDAELKNIAEDFPDGAVFYGEGVGPDIQGNKYEEFGIIIFDIKVGKWWIKALDVNPIAAKYNLRSPIPFVATIKQVIENVEISPCPTSRYTSFGIEGFVGKPLGGLMDRGGDRIITKIKVKDFTKENNDKGRVSRHTREEGKSNSEDA